LHVVEGEGKGFCFDHESLEPWPDAVCDACAEEPPWSDETAREKIRVLCASCWEDAFERNARPPAADDEDWLRQACASMSRRQDDWVERFGILSRPRYRYSFDGEDAWLGFGADPAPGLREQRLPTELMCDALVIGSWSSVSDTWLWGWANDWWEPRVTRDVVRVKRFAEEKGLTRLWKKGFPADEKLAWHLALGALSLLPELEGVYRAPNANGSLFLGAMRTRLVS
jgi:hypothetical protein